MRRNLYALPESFEQYGEKELFILANVIQTPSYISYLSALSYYGLTTQIPQSLIESANAVRKRDFRVRSVLFRYHYCAPRYFFGYGRREGFFISEPEKALLDSLYLVSLGRYALDQSALSLQEIRWEKIKRWLKKYPKRFRTYFKKWKEQYENS